MVKKRPKLKKPKGPVDKFYKFRVIKLKGVDISNPNNQATTHNVIRFYRDWINKQKLSIHSSSGKDKHGNIAPAEFTLTQPEFEHYSVMTDPDDTPWLKPLTRERLKFMQQKEEKDQTTTDRRNLNLALNGGKKGQYIIDENGEIVLENEHRIRLVEIIEKPKEENYGN